MILGMLLLALLAPGASPSPTAHLAPSAPADTTQAAARALFAGLDGTWSCQGAFADGRALEADLTFTAAMNGRSVRYQHRDRAPSKFMQDAYWTVDAASGRMVSLALAAMGEEADVHAYLFVAPEWTEQTVTLESDTLVAPPWARNRFTYTLESPEALRMVWDLHRGGEWRMGDFLECRRSAHGEALSAAP